MRRWLVQHLMGKESYQATLLGLTQVLDEWAVTVVDPAMQEHPDDLQVVAEVRDDMKAIDKFWFPEHLTDRIYQES